MSIVLIALAAALACAPASVLPLALGHWQVWRPRLALLLWLGIGALGLALALGSVLVAALLVLAAPPGTGAGTAVPLVLIAWLGLGGAGMLASLALGREPARAGDLDGHAEDATLDASPEAARTSAVTRRIIEDTTVDAVLYEVEEPGLIACAIGGRHREILVSRRAREELTRSELRGVLAHEAAHLRSHHAAVRRLCAWHAACLPRRSDLRRLLVTRVHLLTELAADDAAARVVGRGRLCASLRAAHGLSPSPELLVRAERLASLGPGIGGSPRLTHRSPARA